MFRLENISKQFSAQFVLQNFSTEIKEGDKVIIVGRSGIGKTTLFRLLLGFEVPENGTIFFNDQLLDHQRIWELRRKVAYVSQDLNIGNGNVKAFLEDTLSIKANIQYKESLEADLNKLLDYFELPYSILTKDIDGLSGGEKQRIAIINALILKRKIFFLDEITSALDKNLKVKTMDYFFQNLEFTILSISHDNYMPRNVEIKTIKLENV